MGATTLVWLHLLLLWLLTLLIYSLNIGHGFIHDDFSWIYDAARKPGWYGFSHRCGGPFFSPLGWLTFKLDWTLWGLWAFPYAFENLFLHLLNISLLYWLALQLWKLRQAAWWTALGYSLLFPANVWAVMWIATRAHLLAVFFILLTLCSALRYIRANEVNMTRWGKFRAALLMFLAAASGMLSKECGVTAPAAVLILWGYEKQFRFRQWITRETLAWAAALGVLLAVYLWLRSQSGALSVMTRDPWYGYAFSIDVLVENLLKYSWRTYGLLLILVFAMSLYERSNASVVGGLGGMWRELLFSLALFSIALAPFLLIRGRSGMYTYWPGIGASLLLGALSRNGTSARAMQSDRRWWTGLPFAIVVLTLAGFSFGQSQR